MPNCQPDQCSYRGRCLNGGESYLCQTCYTFQVQTRRGPQLRTRLFSHSSQGKCSTCRVVTDNGVQAAVIEPYDVPCKQCTDTQAEYNMLPISGVPSWPKPKPIDKVGPTPCDECVVDIAANGQQSERWLNCSEQNPDAENCDCWVPDEPRYGRPRCVCCDTPCGPCETCVKHGRTARCESLCNKNGRVNEICVPAGPPVVAGPMEEGVCDCKYVPYDVNGLTWHQAFYGYEMCTEALPTPKADCKGCECTVTQAICGSSLILNPLKCACEPPCPNCLPENCDECVRIAPGNLPSSFECQHQCVAPEECDGDGNCYDPNTANGLALSLGDTELIP